MKSRIKHAEHKMRVAFYSPEISFFQNILRSDKYSVAQKSLDVRCLGRVKGTSAPLCIQRVTLEVVAEERVGFPASCVSVWFRFNQSLDESTN
jgi:hypothetical protein